MGNCTAKNITDGRVLIFYKGKEKVLKTEQYTYAQLQAKAQRLSNKEESMLLSLSCSGNPLRINNEETWNNLKIAKNKDILIIVISPEKSLQTFEITPTNIKKSDKEYDVIKKNFVDFVHYIDVFDQHLREFVRSMSYFYVRSCSLQTALLMFMILLNPYTSEVTYKMPFIAIGEEKREKLPKVYNELYLKWELIIEDIKDLDYQIGVIENNLSYLIENNLKKPVVINKGRIVNPIGLRKAENNLRLCRARDEFNEICEGLEAFKDSIKKAIDTYSDERHKLITRTTHIIRLAGASDPKDISWVFGMSDYSSIPGDYRFY